MTKSPELSQREQTVLRYLIHDFIESATPIGSRYISRRHEDVLGLGSASIRNIMADLEDRGYLDHPHPSAGRVPTDRGYRFYLDALMHLEQVPDLEQSAIKENLDRADEAEQVLREASLIVGNISRQLCVVSSPRLSSGIVERIELVQLALTRVMVVLSIKAGLVRTILLEVASEIARGKLDEISRILNERLAGLTVQEMRDTFADRVREVTADDTGLIRLFIDSVEKLVVPDRGERLHIAGADKVIDQPEFSQARDFRSVIELINNEEMIIHVLRRTEGTPPAVRVTVGRENEDERLQPYSVISANYTAGDTVGSVGVIGPRRMNYARMIPLVDYVARAISAMFTNQSKPS
jgi:heat-inducible transcriptional repressor